MSLVFFFKQKTAYEMRISDWSSDVCSSDLDGLHSAPITRFARGRTAANLHRQQDGHPDRHSDPVHLLVVLEYLGDRDCDVHPQDGKGRANPHVRIDRQYWRRLCRSEEHTSELQSLMRISYAVLCLKTKKHK